MVELYALACSYAKEGAMELLEIEAEILAPAEGTVEPTEGDACGIAHVAQTVDSRGGICGSAKGVFVLELELEAVGAAADILGDLDEVAKHVVEYGIGMGTEGDTHRGRAGSRSEIGFAHMGVDDG